MSQTDTQDTQAEGPTKRPHRLTARANKVVAPVKKRYSGSFAEQHWNRLSEVDFINKGMLFAAVLLLCAFPFYIVVNSLAGHSAANGIARRLGLNQHAAADVSHVFAPASSTSASLSGLAYVFFILGGIAAAAAVTDLYQQVFHLKGRGMKNLPQELAWLAVVIGGSLVMGRVGPAFHAAVGPFVYVLGVGFFALFWWFTMWLLLAGRVRWRTLLPAAIATAICWIGMEVVFALTFSSDIISNDKKYGPIGVVFALMSFLIAIGVVIIIGAVFGVVWQERKHPDTSEGSVDTDAKPEA
jgi:membrane protein